MKNIHISGGTAQLQGFKERTDLEIRQVCDSFIQPRVTVNSDTEAAFRALFNITKSNWFEDIAMPKTLYNEMGFSRLSALI